MKVETKAHRIYSAAADAIQKFGHAKGLLVDNKGRLCLWGAISLVMHRDPCRCSGRSHNLARALRPFCDDRDPISWNNAAGRTKSQVIAVLRKASRAHKLASS